MQEDKRPPSVAEFTFKAVIAGLAFGVLFGAANAYLGLKSGLTVSTSIPIAVLAAVTFKFLPRGGTILEANISQTIGSASSSLAAGTIFTIPALFMWGMVPSFTQVALLALAGGMLGILAMVPLRRLLIVQADAELPYPEGRACAEVLQATQKSVRAAKWVFIGIGVGFFVKLFLTLGRFWPEEVAWHPTILPNGALTLAIAPAYVAVGYIVGFRAASVMVSGALLAALVLYPLVTKAHAAGLVDAATATGDGLTRAAVRSRFMLYVGAGAVAMAGIVTVVRTAPTMLKSLQAVLGSKKSSANDATTPRTDRDVPRAVIFAGIAALVTGLILVPNIFAGELSIGARVVAAIGVAIFGFLFVPVSSRLVGVIGVSSNPTSAMALITLVGTASIFLALGWKGLAAQAAVLTVGTVVCVAASKAGDISQDLKTGWLVGGTPYLQQYGQMIAACVACWAIAAVVITLGNQYGFGDDGLQAPQARLMKTMVEAVLGAQLPWDLLIAGAVTSFVGVLVGLPALPFALGIYLPLATLACVFVGGFVRRLVEKRGEGRMDLEAGILCASGYVAGEGLAGVGVSGWAYSQSWGRRDPVEGTLITSLLSVLLLAAVCFLLYRASSRRATARSVTPDAP